MITLQEVMERELNAQADFLLKMGFQLDRVEAILDEAEHRAIFTEQCKRLHAAETSE